MITMKCLYISNHSVIFLILVIIILYQTLYIIINQLNMASLDESILSSYGGLEQNSKTNLFDDTMR